MHASAQTRGVQALLLVGGVLPWIVGCAAPASDPGFAGARGVAERVRTQLARVSDTAFRPYLETAPAGMVLRLEHRCREVGRIPLPVPTIDSLDAIASDGGTFLDDLEIPGATCDSILRARRATDDTLVVIQLVHDAYGAADTVAATTILALHEWFHHAWFEDGHRLPDRLMTRAARALADQAAPVEGASTASLRTTARTALAEALSATTRADRAAALGRYRCARRALFADQPALDTLTQVREAVEGPAIVTSMRVGRTLGLLDRDPREVIRAALAGRLWMRQDTAAAEPGREFHYVTAAALTLLAEATIPGAIDSLRNGGLLEGLVVPDTGSCPSR